MNAPKPISAAEAQALVRNGAVLVDIREAPERRSGMIRGAVHAPLSALDRTNLDITPRHAVIFHCRRGGRTTRHAAALQATAGAAEAYLLEGGLDAWRAAALPIERSW
ncbi:MAG TPA: rhodanese-like domain-containing protein [Steroidobacteraceae bacterium]|nr:rhodanese-like domain-containing protein [Steroidobacteraceae bacterium]